MQRRLTRTPALSLHGQCEKAQSGSLHKGRRDARARALPLVLMAAVPIAAVPGCAVGADYKDTRSSTPLLVSFFFGALLLLRRGGRRARALGLALGLVRLAVIRRTFVPLTHTCTCRHGFSPENALQGCHVRMCFRFCTQQRSNGTSRRASCSDEMMGPSGGGEWCSFEGKR